MTKILRDYQQKLKYDIYTAWQSGHRNVCAVAPTGSGKTEVKASIFEECQVPGIAIAHRQELVSQISNALAGHGVYHRIIAPKAIIAFCVSQHVKLFGRSYHHAQAPIAVAGVDTLNARSDELTQFINQCRIWDIDEGHHVLKANKWGKAAALFKNAVGVGFTATPVRCDRKALGRAKSGVYDVLVIGPGMRELINRGYLADYRVFVPPASYVMTDDDIGPSGEFIDKKLREKSHGSKITGDIVEHYLKFAPGKQGITFTVDVETSVDVAAAFRQKGVPAEAISGTTPDTVRTSLIERFRRGETKQLVNVDLFGEGFDVPSVEVVSDGRRTQSFPRYAQAFGRALRPAPGKTHGIYIDHTGNVKQHKLPDRPRVWSLDDEERGKRSVAADDVIPLTTCTNCFQPFESVTNVCPHCGHVIEPQSRSAPQFVDGDLIELDPLVLAQMRGEVDKVTKWFGGSPSTPAEKVMFQNWNLKCDAQKELRECIALWAGVQKEVYQRSDSESYRRFYHTFGVDVLTAQTLGRPDAEKLTRMIREQWI